MSLAQQLLRSLVARFWEERASRRSCAGVPSCTTVSCSLLRPPDFEDVLTSWPGDSRRRGWFAPTSVPFPLFGDVARGVNVARHARAVARAREGGGAGTTVRYVDSSVERLQVSRRLTPIGSPSRATGARCASRPTKRRDSRGRRYRAWQPPSCLHPTIAPHAPLTSISADTWLGRSLGGCQSSRTLAAATTISFREQLRGGKPPPPGSRRSAYARRSASNPCIEPGIPIHLDLRTHLMSDLGSVDGAVAAPDDTARPCAPTARRRAYYDELQEARRRARPHWAAFAERAGGSTTCRGQKRLSRQLHENVTYNVRVGTLRAWASTSSAHVATADWERLAQGLRQRAVAQWCADIYGPQALLTEGCAAGGDSGICPAVSRAAVGRLSPPARLRSRGRRTAPGASSRRGRGAIGRGLRAENRLSACSSFRMPFATSTCSARVLHFASEIAAQTACRQRHAAHRPAHAGPQQTYSSAYLSLSGFTLVKAPTSRRADRLFLKMPASAPCTILLVWTTTLSGAGLKSH